ncbi:copper resistance CopC family protein [Pseudalkalibacillus sp. SCS-8]|uniref:copper resistance CopC family protein n=1 Tax=Pseudalkalibacillus nanhaiensis TaxID=3115291 RepID=UPI0032DABF23
MYKFIIIGITILLGVLSQPLVTSAHAELVGTTPGEGEVVGYAVDVVTFEFSTDIEEGSQFSIKDQNDQSIDVNTIQIDGNLMLGELSDPLASGTYEVKYKIVSEDSHIVEGDYTFTVKDDTKMQEESSEKVEEDEAIGEEQQDEDTSNETDRAKDQNGLTEKGEVEDGLSPIVLIFAGILILGGAAFLFWMVRRKGTA